MFINTKLLSKDRELNKEHFPKKKKSLSGIINE